MNKSSGKFKCPKCRNGEVNKFKEWKSRDEYDEDERVIKYIFYNEKETTHEWVCLSCCSCDSCNLENSSCSRKTCVNTLTCYCYYCDWYCCYSCIALSYILFFFWIDLYNYCCNSPTTYIGVRGKDQIRSAKEEEFFTRIDGMTEQEWNNAYKKWTCNNCKYTSSSFIDFIPSQTKTKEKNEDYIAIRFISQDQTINYPIPCKIDEPFNSVEKKLNKEYPELTKKNCVFLVNGISIDRNKSLKDNKIKGGDCITIADLEMD